MNDSMIDWVYIINQVFMVEQKDFIYFNQILGKEIKVYFVEGEVCKVDVIGNVLVVYYFQE